MNRVFTIWIFCFFACFLASATNVSFNLTDPQYGISKTTNATVAVQAENISQSGTVTLLPLTLRQLTDTNGQATFTNLYGSSISGFYHWTVAIYQSSQRVQGDMWVSSTNLGTVSESIIDIVNGAPSYPAGTWCWSAYASDIRYQLSGNAQSNSFYPLFSNPSNYVQNSTLLTTSNALQVQIGSAGISAGTATNIANVVYSNNPSGYISSVPSGATNLFIYGLVATNSFDPTNSAAAVRTQILSSNYLATIPVSATNSFLTSVPSSATNRYTLTNDTTWFDAKGAAQIATNDLAPKIIASTNGIGIASGLMAFQPTNAWAGYQFTTNLVTVTSNGISAIAGTASNAIANVNGFGTNTTLATAKSISVTNLNSQNFTNTGNAFIASSAFGSLSSIGSGSYASVSPTYWQLASNSWAWTKDKTIFAQPPNFSSPIDQLELFYVGAAGNSGRCFEFDPDGTLRVYSLVVQSLTVASGITNASIVYQGGNYTNGTIQGTLGVGGLPGYLLSTTNVVGMRNAGVSLANGTYTIISGGLYTNTFGNGSDLNFQNPTWFQRTNGVNLYSASSLAVGTTWNNVIGSTTVPNSSYGYTNDLTGIVFYNFTSPTNLVTGSLTTVLAGTNVTVSAVGSAYTVNVPTQSFLTNDMTTKNYVTNAINAATNGFVSSTIINGLATTNYVNSGDTSVTNGATRVFFFNSNPSNSVIVSSSSIGFNTNGMLWINRNGNSNNWLVLITTNR